MISQAHYYYFFDLLLFWLDSGTTSFAQATRQKLTSICAPPCRAKMPAWKQTHGTEPVTVLRSNANTSDLWENFWISRLIKVPYMWFQTGKRGWSLSVSEFLPKERHSCKETIWLKISILVSISRQGKACQPSNQAMYVYSVYHTSDITQVTEAFIAHPPNET